MVELTVRRSLALAAERAGERTARRCAARTLSHSALNALSNRIANGLLALGAAKGERVAIALPNCAEYVAAAIVPRVARALDEAALLAACRASLAGYKVPKSFELRAELPRNANGKVLKRALREQFVSGRAVGRSGEALRDLAGGLI